ncbi:MAG TPA: hypothetical protein DCS93_08965 [Microscillaceae bacterium]|nr:hypothetical protein [Microscillaceae bacterium]
MSAQQKILLTIWTTLLVLFRPSVFGLLANPIVFLFFMIVSALIVYSRPMSVIKVNRNNFLALATIVIFGVYVLLQGLLLSSSKITVIKSAIIVIFTPIAIFYVLRVANKYFIMKIFIYIHAILCASNLVTFLLFFLLGGNVDNLPVILNLEDILGISIYQEGYPLSVHLLMFPFTLSWGAGNFLFIVETYRFSAIYTEPGLAQLYLITAFLFTYFTPLKRVKIIRFLLITGVLATFSTISYINLLLGYATMRILSNLEIRQIIKAWFNPFRLIFLSIFFAIGGYYAYGKVISKLETESGAARLYSYQTALDKLRSSPILGQGYYNDFDQEQQLVTVGKWKVSEQFIGLVGVSYQIGLFGIGLYLLCWGAGIRLLANRESLCIYIPAFITLLIAQPNYNDVFIFFLLLLNTSQFKVINTEKKVTQKTLLSTHQ